MARRKRNTDLIPIDKLDLLADGYKNELETNPKYSLMVDPENIYDMSENQKKFIEYYVQFKNIPTAASLANIEPSLAKQYFVDFASQQEIRRINLAMYHRQFASKMATIDELGGYLTSQLTDENVPIGQQLNQNQKLKVANMLIELNKLKQSALSKPETIDYIEVEDQISELSIDDIKKLLNSNNQIETKNNKENLIKELQLKSNFNSEEIAYLKTLRLEDLKELLRISEENNDNK